MIWWEALILGIIQGLTEFLPISSSGHLVIFQKILGFSKPPIAFDTLVHFGTLVALLFFFWTNIKKILRGFLEEIKDKERRDSSNLIFCLIVGSIPIAIVGFLLKDSIEAIFNSLFLIGFCFLGTATILFLTSFFKKQVKDLGATNDGKIGFIDTLFIGLFQAVAILPGISRSGWTISAGIYRGFKREAAFNFSFYLGMIAIFGAVIIQIPEISAIEPVNGILGFFSSAIIGFLSLKILRRLVIRGKFHYFGIYCAILGAICLLANHGL
jgi:undecaprenyl-diphosphatase